ncbi:MAG: PA2169 family four-helix-bundle protein [Flavobacteriales bacterium]
MDQKKDLTELNNVHDLLVDGRKGYAEASQRADDRRVKDLLMAFSSERATLEADLDAELRKLDPGAPHRDGTLKGDLHRTWMEVRDALSKADNANLLAECERGESYLLMRYDDILKNHDLAAGTRSLLQEQRNAVQGNMDRVKTLRSQFEHIEK